jgi:hypothetical protein
MSDCDVNFEVYMEGPNDEKYLPNGEPRKLEEIKPIESIWELRAKALGKESPRSESLAKMNTGSTAPKVDPVDPVARMVREASGQWFKKNFPGTAEQREIEQARQDKAEGYHQGMLKFLRDRVYQGIEGAESDLKNYEAALNAA